MLKSLFILIFAAIGLTLVACSTQLDSDEPAPAAIDNSVNAVVAPRTNLSAPSENPTTSSVTASIASSADSLTSLDVTSRSSDSLTAPRPIVEQGNEVSDTAFGFTLPNALGSDQTLESFRGDKNVVVVFYRAFW